MESTKPRINQTTLSASGGTYYPSLLGMEAKELTQKISLEVEKIDAW